MFLFFKGLHLISLTASVIMYVVRGIMMMQGSDKLDDKFFRIAPNYIDGLLVVSALGAAVALGMYPFLNAWATAKLIGTLVYLGCVHAAFPKRRIALYWAGILPLAYLAATALCRDPLACLGTP